MASSSSNRPATVAGRQWSRSSWIPKGSRPLFRLNRSSGQFASTPYRVVTTESRRGGGPRPAISRTTAWPGSTTSPGLSGASVGSVGDEAFNSGGQERRLIQRNQGEMTRADLGPPREPRFPMGQASG